MREKIESPPSEVASKSQDIGEKGRLPFSFPCEKAKLLPERFSFYGIAARTAIAAIARSFGMECGMIRSVLSRKDV